VVYKRKVYLLFFLLIFAIWEKAFSQMAINPVTFSSIDHDRVLDACRDTKGNLYALVQTHMQQVNIRMPDKETKVPAHGPLVVVYDAAGNLVKTVPVDFVAPVLTAIAVDQESNIY
jgi:hypothetical protein